MAGQVECSVDLTEGPPGTQGAWNAIVSASGRSRFAEIMRQMDVRYRGLSAEELDRWMQRNEDRGRRPLLAGLRSRNGMIIQVAGFTERKRTDGRPPQRVLCMTGVDPAAWPRVSPEAVSDMAVWLAELIRCAAVCFGRPVDIEAIRPKTMTYGPMQEMHDCMYDGLRVRIPEEPDMWLRAQVREQNDRGHAVFLRIRVDV